MNTVTNEESEEESDEDSEDEDDDQEEGAEEGEELEAGASDEMSPAQLPEHSVGSLGSPSRSDREDLHSITPHRSRGEDEDDRSSRSSVRHLSRSPPGSRHSSREASFSRPESPSSLANHTATLSLSDPRRESSSAPKDITERVYSEVSKQRAKQQRKYHSKKGAQRVGRPKGSKAKMDGRLKLDTGGWD